MDDPKVETVPVPVDEYRELKRRSEFLGRLEAAGVDNWEGYEHAQD